MVTRSPVSFGVPFPTDSHQSEKGNSRAQGGAREMPLPGATASGRARWRASATELRRSPKSNRLRISRRASVGHQKALASTSLRHGEFIPSEMVVVEIEVHGPPSCGLYMHGRQNLGEPETRSVARGTV